MTYRMPDPLHHNDAALHTARRRASNNRTPAARHLRPGGRFVIELWYLSYANSRRDNRPPSSPRSPAMVGLDTYDVLHQRVVSHHFTFGTGKQARLFRSPYRYIWAFGTG